MTATLNPSTILEETFGFDSFRPGQEETIQRLLDGRSSLAIFPTGAGKSLCFQLPALVLDGLTLVISPLIALMKDQIDFLQSRGVAAARLDSSLSREETLAVYDALHDGELSLLYIAPERLANERFLHTLKRIRIPLMAVDEAHCISEWGHNFRPDYLKIAGLAKSLDVGRVLALTATATPQVAQDVAEAFEIAPDDIVATGFYRPNLELRVTPCRAAEKNERLLERMESGPDGSTLIYVTRQKTAERVAEWLTERSRPAVAYHAGMKSEARNRVQDDFMTGRTPIVVATIAFGMGIDKADIRAIYHYDLPKSLEGYMQQIGRAGRDGKPAVCEMLACRSDRVELESFIYGDTPDPGAITGIVDELLDGAERFSVSLYRLSVRHDIRRLVVRTLLTYLELDGVLRPTGPFYDAYKIRPNRSSEEICARFDEGRTAFLLSVFRCMEKKKTWFHLDLSETVEKTGHDRDRIVAALGYLEELGDLEIKASGLRHGYRRTARRVDRDALIRTLRERFAEREKQDLARIRKILDLAETEGCLTRELLAYFGEERDDCGHCSRCAGIPGKPLPDDPPAPPTPEEEEMVAGLLAEEQPALQSARQVARYLCGIRSPAATRARLTSRPEFGIWRRRPFEEVLKQVE